ncbi:MAG: hypothetical protein ACKOEO_20400, partial [Planctomycetaceae bacterium]
MTLTQLTSLLRRILHPGKSSAPPSLRRLKMLRLEDRRVFSASLALTGVQLIGGENLTVSSGGQQDLGTGSSVDTVRLEVTEGTWSIDSSIADTQYNLLPGDQTLLLDAQFFLNNATTNNSLPIQGSAAQTDNVTINVDQLILPAGGINFIGGEDSSAADNDSLTIEGYAIDQDDNIGTADLLVVHAGPEKGHVELSGLGTIRFEELEPLSLKGTAADLRFDLPASDDPNIILSDDAAAGNGFSRIDGDGFELTNFRNPTASLLINDPVGVKQIFVRGLDSEFQADLIFSDASDNSMTFEQHDLDTGGGRLIIDADQIQFLTSVRTLGGAIDVFADSGISSTAAAQLDTSAAAGSGLDGGNVDL